MKTIRSVIDNSLTPKNAESRGYIYINDVPDLLQSVNNLLLEAAKSGYRLGIAKRSSRRVGLYRLKNY